MSTIWEDEFGDEYTKRNRVNWRARIPFWRTVLNATNAKTILEVGCNSGWNLRAIQKIDPTVELKGTDINRTALAEAKEAGFDVEYHAALELGHKETHDLVFTAGVLIHIPPKDLSAVMDAIIAASKKHVVAVEYYSQREENIEYRGHDDALWKRPFGQMYIDKGLSLVSISHLYKTDGFDNCTCWIFKK